MIFVTLVCAALAALVVSLVTGLAAVSSPRAYWVALAATLVALLAYVATDASYYGPARQVGFGLGWAAGGLLGGIVSLARHAKAPPAA